MCSSVSTSCVKTASRAIITEANERHTFVHENHLDDRIMRYVDLMRAHTVGAAISWSVITVAELFRRDVIDLRQWRCRRERKRDLVDERNHVVAGWRNCEYTGIVK